MLSYLKELAKIFPVQAQLHRMHLFGREADAEQLLQSLHKQLSHHSHDKRRIAEAMDDQYAHLFLKSAVINGWRTRMRLTLGLRRSERKGGGYERAVEELINAVQAHQRGIPTPRIIAFGYNLTVMGWVSELFIVSENLADHINGEKWLASPSHNPQEFARQATALIAQMVGADVMHLDTWAANFMVPADTSCPLQVIDFENCLIGTRGDAAAALGTQFGLLYRITLQRFISEAEFDQLVMDKCPTAPAARDTFLTSYAHAKQHSMSRKEVRQIVLSGRVIRT